MRFPRAPALASAEWTHVALARSRDGAVRLLLNGVEYVGEAKPEEEAKPEDEATSEDEAKPEDEATSEDVTIVWTLGQAHAAPSYDRALTAHVARFTVVAGDCSALEQRAAAATRRGAPTPPPEFEATAFYEAVHHACGGGADALSPAMLTHLGAVADARGAPPTARAVALRAIAALLSAPSPERGGDPWDALLAREGFIERRLE